MKKKEEKLYFNGQWKDMADHLRAFIKTGDQEELHLFRVQVKKLRAMLELLDSDSAKQLLSKDFKPVRKIFKHCGEIRSAYINLQFGVRYQFNNEEFLKNHLYEIEKGTNEVKELGKQYLHTIRTAHGGISHDLKAVSNRAVVKYYKLKLVSIANSLGNLEFNDELHNTRKQVKELIYNRKLAHDALEGQLQINNDYLDKLQGTIGDWHDNMLAMELFMAEGLDFKPVITKIKRQNTRLKRYITALAHDFEKKAILAGKISGQHKIKNGSRD